MRKLGKLMVMSTLPNWVKPRLSFGIGFFFLLYFLVLHLGDKWAERRVIDPWKLDPKALAPNAYIDGYFLFEALAAGIFWLGLDAILELMMIAKACLDSRPHARQRQQHLLAVYDPPPNAVIAPINHDETWRAFFLDILLTKVPILTGKAFLHFFSIGGAAMITELYNVILSDYLSRDDDDPEPIEKIYAEGLEKCRQMRNVIIVGQFVLFLVSRTLSSSIVYGDAPVDQSRNLFTRMWNREKNVWSKLNMLDKTVGSALFFWPKRSRTLTLDQPLRVLPATDHSDYSSRVESPIEFDTVNYGTLNA